MSERHLRWVKRKVVPSFAAEVLEEMTRMNKPVTFGETAIRPDFNEWLPEMLKRAKYQGSVMARAFFDSVAMISRSRDMVTSGMEEEGLSLLTEVYHVWEFPLVDVNFFLPIVQRRLDANPKDRLGLLLFMHLTKMGLAESCHFLEKCIEAHPLEAAFHHRLSCIYGFQEKYREALRAMDRALELFPYYDWLYSRASCVRLSNRPNEEVIEAYQAFLSKAPRDHRKVPEAHYCLGSTYLSIHDREKAEAHYRMGRAAEDPALRLPCFDPIREDKFPPKYLLCLTFDRIRDRINSESHDFNSLPAILATPSCGACHKADPKLRCGACKTIWYCDAACQKKAWAQHKLECKKKN